MTVGPEMSRRTIVAARNTRQGARSGIVRSSPQIDHANIQEMIANMHPLGNFCEPRNNRRDGGGGAPDRTTLASDTASVLTTADYRNESCGINCPFGHLY